MFCPIIVLPSEDVALESLTTSCVNLVLLFITLDPAPEIVKSVPSVLIDTLGAASPKTIELSDVGKLIGP